MNKKNETRTETDLEASLRAITASYIAGLPGRLGEIENCLQRCLDAPEAVAHYEALALQLHSVAGSAGTFGFSELGFRASDLEIALNAFIQEAEHKDENAAGAFAPIATSVGAFLQWAASHVNARNPEPAPVDAGRRTP